MFKNIINLFRETPEAKNRRRDAVFAYVKTPLTEAERSKDNLQVFLWSAGMYSKEYSECDLKLLVVQRNKDVLGEVAYNDLVKAIRMDNRGCSAHPYDVET